MTVALQERYCLLCMELFSIFYWIKNRGRPCGRLDQPHPLQARVAVLADDDVVVHGDAERGGDVDDRLGIRSGSSSAIDDPIKSRIPNRRPFLLHPGRLLTRANDIGDDCS
jgi:hypothetical protein